MIEQPTNQPKRIVAILKWGAARLHFPLFCLLIWAIFEWDKRDAQDELAKEFESIPAGIVRVRVPGAVGTGFAIGDDGMIATAYHVICKADQIRVIAGAKELPAKVWGLVPEHDLAFLQIEPGIIPPLRPTTSHEGLKAYGNPSGHIEVVDVEISGRFLSPDGGYWMEIRGRVRPGYSGGPIVAGDGGIVGMTERGREDRHVILPAEQIWKYAGRFLLSEARPPQQVQYPKEREELLRESLTNSPYLWYTAGIKALESGRNEEAFKCFESVLKYDPTMWQAYDALGVIAMKDKRYDAAVEFYEKSAGMHPTATAYFKLAGACMYNQDIKAGIDQLEYTLRLQPSHEGARAILAEIRRAKANNATIQFREADVR